MFSRYLNPDEAFDMGYVGWFAEYPDPDDFLNVLIEDGEVTPSFRNASVKEQLAAAAQLTGEKRVLAYARLDRQVTSKYAPLVAWGDQSAYSLFSRRIGCQVFSPYYLMDLAALCVRHAAR
jgi:ABC-type oligopeptide transport system substrate-binding subunit